MCGVVDENLDIIVPIKYNNIGIFDAHETDEWKIGIVDRNGNLIHEYIDGYITAYNGFINDVKQSVYEVQTKYRKYLWSIE